MGLYRFWLVVVITGLLGASSCAPTRVVKPLKKNEQAVGFNLGGPMINQFGTTFPIPLSSLSYARGLTDKQTLFASWHTTSALFGVMQLEVGALHEFFPADSLSFWKPGLSGNLTGNIGFDVWEGNFKFWPQLDLNTYWTYGKHQSFVYAGLSNWFELSGQRAHGETQPNTWIFNPHIGHTFRRKHWDYNLELKYLAPNISNRDIVVDYASPGNNGAMGLYFTIGRRF